jgi:hypothetical protein
MWKEVIIAYFKVLSLQSPGRTEENQEKSLDCLCLGRVSNREPSEYM